MFIAQERDKNYEVIVHDLYIHSVEASVNAPPFLVILILSHYTLAQIPMVSTCIHFPENFLWHLGCPL